MQQFIDELKIKVVAGHGGAGKVSFRKEAHVPHGGPDGGDGGKGGDVILLCDRRVTTFSAYKSKKVYKAENGEDGKTRMAFGKKGTDLIVKVPEGTLVYDEENELIADLTKDGESTLLAKGGLGGKGNYFYATSTNQAPEYAQHGLQGEEKEIRLSVKLIADVGLVGYPNAGKSTLLSVLTKAHPKIADYPFTTLIPNLGVCYIDFDASFVIADIPGIIEGAHNGAGLGFQFLKHIERTGLLAFVLDIYESYTIDEFRKLRGELKEYNETLSKKNFVLVFNKNDLSDDELDKEIIDTFTASLNEEEKFLLKGVLSVSAATQKGISDLSKTLYSLSKDSKE